MKQMKIPNCDNRTWAKMISGQAAMKFIIKLVTQFGLMKVHQWRVVHPSSLSSGLIVKCWEAENLCWGEGNGPDKHVSWSSWGNLVTIFADVCISLPTPAHFITWRSWINATAAFHHAGQKSVFFKAVEFDGILLLALVSSCICQAVY